jgi:D-alanyl-D-alanine dipeptidase
MLATMQEPVLMSDVRVTALPTQDSAEPIVDLEAAGILRFSDRKRANNPRIGFARETMARLLSEARTHLPSGIRFLGVEAYRPPRLQLLYYRTYRDRLRAERPELTAEELDVLTSRFVSPPEVAPHPSGAAIDLTLISGDGHELDLGCAVDATPEESNGASYTEARGLSTDAAANRRLLVSALAAVGLVNYPTEWWHWSFGDRYWAMATGAGAALYSAVPE